MSELEQLLQERIEQLETGNALESCLYGLPEQETGALRIIAAMRELSVEEMDESLLATQRANVMAAAVRRLGGTAVPPPPATPSFLAQLQTWFDSLLLRRELTVGLAFIFITAFLGVALLIFSSGENGNEKLALTPKVEISPTEVAAIDSPPTTTAEEVVEAQPTEVVETATAAAVNEPETAAVVTTPTLETAFLPLLNVPLNLNAGTAVVEAAAGLVEIQGADGTWTAVNGLGTLTAGQRVRTSSLSQATLTFFDGSQVLLSANTELSLDQLNAQRPEDGLRAIVMTQHVGESEHSVELRNDAGSRYEVNTPAGSGIARGTKFKVVVTPGLLARFAVSEGAVDVTGLSQTVSVTAGQATAVLAGSPPQAPRFTISGEGEVSQTGGVWTIGGQTFQTHNQTTIIGEPQVGDLVFVEGHLSEDGGRVADRIGLLRPAVVNHFTLTGAVEAMDAAVWTVAGQTILIDDQTTIETGIASGDTVRLRGVILAGGSLLAQQIERVNDQPGFPFHFTGIVQNIQADTWLISGNSLTVDAETIVDDDMAVGDVVEVSGWILEDSTWLASRIVRVEDDLPEFSLSGLVQNSDPWRVAGISFATRDWTIIDSSIGVGDLVRVRGVILADGTWVASVIDKIDDDDDDDDDDDETIVLIGIVNALNPWIVNGLQFLVTDDTVILGNIAVGDRVVVEIRLLANGTWQVMSIRPLTPTFGLGCFIINTVVTAVQPNQLLLQHWPAISLDDDDDDDDFEIQGAIETNSIISFPICILFDNTIIIIGNIIVIYQPPIIIIAPPTGGNNNGGQFTPPPANNSNNNGGQFTPPPANNNNNGSQFTPPSSNGNNNNNQNG